MIKFISNFIILISLFTFGCQTGQVIPKETYSDPAFNPYILKYKQYKKKYAGTTKIQEIIFIFKSLEHPTAGTCQRFTTETRIITIDPVTWYNSSKIEKEIIFLHEMGHCDLDREHIEDVNSIMYPKVLNHDFKNNKSFYLEELFSE